MQSELADVHQTRVSRSTLGVKVECEPIGPTRRSVESGRKGTWGRHRTVVAQQSVQVG
jgi:hypothetical protein